MTEAGNISAPDAELGAALFDERLTGRRARMIQRAVIARLRRRGEIDEATAANLEAKGWQEFVEWVLENGPAILEFVMRIVALFSAI